METTLRQKAEALWHTQRVKRLVRDHLGSGAQSLVSVRETMCTDPYFPTAGMEPTLELSPAVANIVRAKPRAALLTRLNFCQTGRWLGRKKVSRREVRGLVAYILYQGLEAGLMYQTSWGTEFVIEPSTIDEAFDGRPEQTLPAEGDDWRDEPGSYDRAISDWIKRAQNGEIRTAPDKRWYMRLLLLDLAKRTPIMDVVAND